MSQDEIATPQSPKRQRGRGRIFQRPNSTHFWIAYCHRGREIRETSYKPRDGFYGTESDAKRLLKQRLDEIGADRLRAKRFVGPQAERVTVGDLLNLLEADYSLRKVRAWASFQSHLRPIRDFFAFERAVDLTEEMVDQYIKDRLAAGKAETTVNRETQLLGQAFRTKKANRLGLTAPDIRRFSEKENARQGFFERADFEAVLRHLHDPDIDDFCAWFYWTGMRPKEIRSLAWPAFDRETWALRLHARDAKTKKGRAIVLEGELRAIIERRLQARRLDCPLIFHREGRPVGEFRKRWQRACRDAGLEGKIPYDLRRTAIRNLIRAGVPERVAMEISGHRTRSVFDRYSITSERDLREAMQKTQRYVHSLPTERTVLPFPKAQEAAPQ